MSARGKQLVFWMAAALVIFLFWSVSSRIQKNERSLAFSEFMTQLERGHIAKVTITGTGAGSQITGEFKNGQSIRTVAPPQMENLVNVMLEKGVEVNARDANSSSWLGHIISWTPIVLMIAFLIFFMRQMQGSGASSLSVADRKDARLELKARLLHLLTLEEEALSAEELLERLSREVTTPLQLVEQWKALYEMLAEGTVEATADNRFRLRPRT